VSASSKHCQRSRWNTDAAVVGALPELPRYTCSASLLTANGLVYFTADDGITSVVRPSDKLDVVAKNELGEYTWSSPAIANGILYIRGEHHLFAIGKR
jgi:hypothetical protein